MTARVLAAHVGIGVLLAVPAGLCAQPVLQRSKPPAYSLALPLGQLGQHAGSRTPAQAFAIEAVGGIAGSLLGFGVIVLGEDDCSVEDLGCHLQTAFLAMVLGTFTSAAGAYVAGRALDTRPSAPGALLGAVAGVAAGLGTWHLFTEELDLVNSTEAAVASFVVAQGVLAGLGSRLVRALQ